MADFDANVIFLEIPEDGEVDKRILAVLANTAAGKADQIVTVSRDIWGVEVVEARFRALDDVERIFGDRDGRSLAVQLKAPTAPRVEGCDSAQVTQRLVVIGGGGFGREVLELIEDINACAGGRTYEVLGVLDDGTPDSELLAQLDVSHLGASQELRDMAPDIGYVIGIGACAARQRIDQECMAWQRTAPILVHPTAVIGRRSVQLGPGSVVCANSTITTNVHLGRSVHVNPNVSIGHDSAVGDYVTLTPQVAVAGNVAIEHGVFVGTGARIKPGVRIGWGALVGAGAVVTRDVAPGQTVAGVPARPMTT